jgi:hypothetical protein
MTVKIRMVNPVKTLLGAAGGVLALGRDVVGHVHWWLRYQVDGEARDDPSEERPERAG